MRKTFALVLTLGLALPATAQLTAQQTRPHRPAHPPAPAPQPAAPQPAPAPRARPAPTPSAAMMEPSRIGTASEAKFAYMIDADTQAVLLDKHGDERMAPSSMTKMMTVYLVFTKLKKGELKTTDEFPVSERAYRMGGSRMFLEQRTRVKVEDLLKGTIVSSGNDSAVALAEGIGGTEEAFAQQMTEMAKTLGMTGTQFRNASGWPDPDHWTTAHDLAMLAWHTIKDFPEYYQIYSETEFVYNNIRQENRNPLLDKRMGVDGMKTGHTETGGFGITVSAQREGRRVILVVNGLTSIRMRQTESERLVDWAFREYNNYALFKPGEAVETLPVWYGEQKTVGLVAERGVTVTLPRTARNSMEVRLRYDNPLEAPIEKGARLGSIEITAPNMDKVTLPLLAVEGVARQNLIGRMGAKASYYLNGSR